jgi:hypothetical protein
MLDYWECGPGWKGGNDRSGCEARSMRKGRDKLYVITTLESTLIIPVLLSQDAGGGPGPFTPPRASATRGYIQFYEKSGTTSGVKGAQTSNAVGVSWVHQSCLDPQQNAQGEAVCYNELMWSGMSGISEDEAKVSCVTATLDRPQTDKTINDWSCEYALCRLLCTEPSLDISDIFKTKFADVTNTPECGPNSLVGEADKCYKLKEKLHVGENIWFDLKASSFFSTEDSVSIEAAAEPGVPIGMSFYLPQPTTPVGRNSRTVTWTPRPGQQDQVHIASFVAFIPPGVPLHLKRTHSIQNTFCTEVHTENTF